ncbi:TPM domain-containing protein [Enterococcus sp. AZ109]|uniref:TPM domain-containing protein n=1 Tax=Enterococcus sp. AZ109 TaxID=2774634 RepID=UPI003F21CCAD
MKNETEEKKHQREFEKITFKADKAMQRIKKRTRIQQAILIILGILCLAIFTWRLLPANYQQHVEEKQSYEAQIANWEEERAAILSGEKEVATGDFAEVLENNLANLNDYPEKADMYTVKIAGTDASIRLNRNNLFVSDNANMLNKTTKKKIYNLNKQLAASTKGSQLQVVTIPELPSGESIESYGEKIFNQLGIGDKDENNGVLYLIALEDREFRLEVGYGLEGLIPDATADDIVNDSDVVDAFGDEDYDQGVNQVLDQVFEMMNSKTALVDSQIANIEKTQQNSQLFYWLPVVLSGVVLISLIGMLLSSARGRKVMKKYYQDYLQQQEAFHRGRNSNEKRALLSKLKRSDFYGLVLIELGTIWSAKQVKNAAKRGKILAKYPKAEKHSMGRILVGDTLYGYNGDVITTAYLASQYNPDNHSDSSGGSGGGGSWGSFGGGSSGGGGASGSW